MDKKEEESASKEPLLQNEQEVANLTTSLTEEPSSSTPNQSRVKDVHIEIPHEKDEEAKAKPTPKPRTSRVSFQSGKIRKKTSIREVRIVAPGDEEHNAEADHLNAMIYAELPSTHRRRAVIFASKPVEKRKSMYTFLGRDSPGYEITPKESRRSVFEESKVISELAEAISRPDEMFINWEEEEEQSDTGNLLQLPFPARLHRVSSMRRESFLDNRKRKHSVRQPRWEDQTDDSMSTKGYIAHMYRDSLWNIDEENFGYRGLSDRWSDVNIWVTDTFNRLDLWGQQIKEIEGNFGIATTSLFRFVRWLIKINFIVSFLFLCFIYIPQLSYDNIFSESPPMPINKTHDYYAKTVSCSREYHDFLEETIDDQDEMDNILNIFSGKGILEDTMLYYGHYSNLSFWVDTNSEKIFGSDYNMSLAYLLTVAFSFLLLFFMIVKNSSGTVRDMVLDLEKKGFPKYSNAIFGGWDYCINNNKTAFFKQKIIYNEFKADLEELELKRQLATRKPAQKTKLFAKRVLMNIFVLAILGGAFYAIVWSGNILLDNQGEDFSAFVTLLVQYMPSIVISVLNIFIPEFFALIAKVEEYPHNVQTALTIVRCVFLRLSLIGVYLVYLYYILQYKDPGPILDCPEAYNKSDCCGNALWQPELENGTTKGIVKCWETYVGQQFYKLALADFIAILLISLLLSFPRSLLYNRFKDRSCVVKTIGKAKFDLPLEVLDIIYSQIVCWVGMFFAPLLPVITFVKMFIYFFLKKLELMFACEAPRNVYRESRSYSFFQTVLLATFLLNIAIWGYMIGNINPSMSCGPFRLYAYEDYVMFNSLTTEVDSWPTVPRRVFRFFGTAAFHIPSFFLLCLGIYYYWTIAQGYKRMEELLKDQLKSEAYDKQFLLARVDEIIKKGELVKDDESFF